MVRRAARAHERSQDPALSDSSVTAILRRGLPGFLREGFLPLAAFYAGLRLSGLGFGIAASLAVSVAVYAGERRLGREGLLVRLSLAFVVVQSVVGLLSHSTNVYLATPILATAVWALAFFVSAAVGRPLAGALASPWYPFPRAFVETAEYKRVFGLESIVWGIYFLARSTVRLIALAYGGAGGLVVVAFLTGVPAVSALVAWSVWYARRELSENSSTRPVRNERGSEFAPLPDRPSV
jgi:hypothetical protein